MNATTSRDEIETALRAELRARTAPLAAGEVPFARLEAAARRDRIHRRTLLGTVVALVVALVAATTAVGAHGGGAGQAPAGGTSLASIPPRGNLVDNTAFIRAVTKRYSGKFRLVYANDDGTHTVVIGIGAAYPNPQLSSDPNPNLASLTVLVGPHDTQVSQLKEQAQEGIDLVRNPSYTFVGNFNGVGQSVPYVVLGPTDLTTAEYATGVQLLDKDGKLVPVRTGITSVRVTDGAAAGEIQAPDDLDDMCRLSGLLAFRGSTDTGAVLNLMPDGSQCLLAPDNYPVEPAYNALREAVVNEAHQDGVTVDEHGSSGQEVTDYAADALADLALLAAVNPSSISCSVEWVGRQTALWDVALIEFDAPGLPKIQALILGLAPGQHYGGYLGLEQSLVRPAVPLTPGLLPVTAAEFGGTQETAAIGFDLTQHW